MAGTALERASEAEDSGSEIDLGWGGADDDSDFELELAAAAADMKLDPKSNTQPDPTAEISDSQQDISKSMDKPKDTTLDATDRLIETESRDTDDEVQPGSPKTFATAAAKVDETIELGWGSDDNNDAEPTDYPDTEPELIDTATSPGPPALVESMESVKSTGPETVEDVEETIDTESVTQKAELLHKVESAEQMPGPTVSELPETTVDTALPGMSEKPKLPEISTQKELGAQSGVSESSMQLNEGEQREELVADASTNVTEEIELTDPAAVKAVHENLPTTVESTPEAEPLNLASTQSAALSATPPSATKPESEPDAEPETASAEESQATSAATTNALQEAILSLKAQLENVEAERDDIQDQYDELLEKVTQIKSTLGERFKADAAELLRLKSELEQSQELNNSAQAEIAELKVSLKAAEMTATAADKGAESADRQVKSALQRAATAESALSMLQQELEEERSMHSSEKQLLEIQAQEAESLGQTLAAELETRERLQTALDLANVEAAKARQLAEQTQIDAAAELENAKRRHENEIKAIKASYEAQIQSLKAAFDADAAEKSELQLRLKNSEQLEQQVKEKTLQVGKLRHEAVILNEHLTNALRLIKKEAEGPTVDKELISNLIVQFATKDRGDTKKFEVLQLIANILSWSEERMIETGLIRDPTALPASAAGEPATGFFGRFAEFLDREARKKTGR